MEQEFIFADTEIFLTVSVKQWQTVCNYTYMYYNDMEWYTVHVTWKLYWAPNFITYSLILL